MKRAHSLYRLFFRRERVEAELDAEVNSYFDTLAERHMERGMSPEEARRAARVQFEGPEQVKERVREVRVGTMIDATLKDVRYALANAAQESRISSRGGLLAGNRHWRDFGDLQHCRRHAAASASRPACKRSYRGNSYLRSNVLGAEPCILSGL